MNEKVTRMMKALTAKSTSTLIEVSVQAKLSSGGKSQKICLIWLGPQKGNLETRMTSVMGHMKPQIQQLAAICAHNLVVITEGYLRGLQMARYLS